MSECTELDANGQRCGGVIGSDGYCQRCGLHAEPPSFPGAVPAFPDSAAPVPPEDQDGSGAASDIGRSAAGSLPAGLVRRGSGLGWRGSGQGWRGAGKPIEAEFDPRDLLRPDAVVPEDKRFCGNCREPVGRSTPDRPGRVEGFCPQCGRAYSFRPHLRPGTKVAGRYVVEGPIGRGGLGWVYLATDQTVGRYVVLKGLMDPNNPENRLVPVDELQALGQAQHRNIVQVFDSVPHPYREPGPDGRLVSIDYIVMEYIGGHTLLELLRKQPVPPGKSSGHLPVAEVCEYMLPALDALDYLHRRGLLYNDFSPDNLMRAHDGRICLIDLGGVSLINEPGGTWGKEGYRDPWVHPPTVQSDLFSVGRTMAVLTFEVPLFREANRGLPGPAEEPLLARHESFYLFLLRATHPDPAQRFSSAAEMAAQLEAVLREVRAVEENRPQPGLSEVFGPELRVVGAEYDQFPDRPDRVAAALALPDPQVDPTDPHARRLAVIAGAGGPREVLRALAELPEQSPETRLRMVRARIELAAAELRTDELDAVRAELANWQERTEDVRVHWFAGLADLIAGRVGEAAAAFEVVLRTVPGDAAPKLALGLCGELLGRNEEAARRYGTVWQTDRSYVSAAFGLARAKLALGDPAEAISALREVPVNSRYASSALLAALVAAGREGGKLAPELFEIAGELRERDVDEQRRWLGYRIAFRAALDWIRAGKAWPERAGTPAPSELLGYPLDEHGMRDGLEHSCRRLAQAIPHQRNYWVDRANAVRNWSIW